MRVDSNYLRAKLSELWPDLDMAILVDTDFILPKLDQMIKMFNDSKLYEMQFIPQFNDCDNFALHFLSQTRIKRYKMLMNKEITTDEMFPWALGIAICTESRGIASPHAVNIAICEEGIYIFDMTPDSHRFWKASKEMDNPVILFM